MGMGFAQTWLRQVSPPLLHMTTLITATLFYSRLEIRHAIDRRTERTTTINA